MGPHLRATRRSTSPFLLAARPCLLGGLVVELVVMLVGGCGLVAGHR